MNWTILVLPQSRLLVTLSVNVKMNWTILVLPLSSKISCFHKVRLENELNYISIATS